MTPRHYLARLLHRWADHLSIAADYCARAAERVAPSVTATLAVMHEIEALEGVEDAVVHARRSSGYRALNASASRAVLVSRFKSGCSSLRSSRLLKYPAASVRAAARRQRRQ